MKKLFENMKISKKLVTAFVFMVLLAVIVGLVGIFSMRAMAEKQQETYDTCTLGIQYASKANTDFMALGKMVSGLQINMNDPDMKQQYLDKVTAATDAISSDLERYGGTLSGDEDQKNFDAVKSAYSDYLSLINNNVTIIKSGGSADELMATMASAASTAQNASDAFDKLVKYNNSQAQENMASSVSAAYACVYTMAGVLILSVAIAAVMSIFLSKIIGGPIQKFAAFAELLAMGDIDASKILTAKDLELKNRKDEIGVLALSFNKVMAGTAKQAKETEAIAGGDLTTEITVRSEQDVMGKALAELVDRLHKLAAAIVDSADQVDSGAKQVADSSTSLSQGATEQASSVEELTASLEEVTSQTAQNAESARTTDELARTIKADAVSGNDQMASMLRAMDDINASSENISKIIKVIEDIAFQTNILALNAAVEAARAGQYGKGFAVVAEEVKNLAGQSSKAAKETTELIENSVRNVDAGTKIVKDTAGALSKIMDGISRVAELVGSIASASNEQSSALEQINEGIIQVSQVVQNNAAASEECAAASEELSAQAIVLKKDVAVFKLRQIK